MRTGSDLFQNSYYVGLIFYAILYGLSLPSSSLTFTH